MDKLLLSALPFITSAVMLTVIQPPVNLASLAWISLVPFIVACSPKTRPRRLAVVCFVVSFLYWLTNLYWIAPITIIGWLTLCLYTALLWPVLALSVRYCRTKKVPLFLASAVLVVGIERMQGLFLGGFFWRFLAHSQYKNITIIQIADIFGASGVSFLIAMVNGLLAELIIAAREKRIFSAGQFVKIGIVITAIVSTILYGRWRISQEDQFIQPGPMTASLQSNVPQSVKRSFESSDVLFDELMEQSNAAAQAGADLIVWPETMVQAALNPEIIKLLPSSHSWVQFDDTLREHSKDNAFVLVGAYGGVPEIGKDLELILAKRFNSAFLYKKDGEKAEKIYNKIHLVPFGEVLPFRRSLPSVYNFLMKFTPYNYDYSLDYGSEYTVFKMETDQPAETYSFSVLICYEDTVPVMARRFTLDEQGQKRLDWLINISNDGWFVRFQDEKVIPSTELAQHAAVCAFRAVENRLAILRSVNTGISCLIDSYGRIRNSFSSGSLPAEAFTRTAMAGWFVDRIPVDKRTSFFSKYGEWLDFCCQGCVLLLIITMFWTKFARCKKRSHKAERLNERRTKKCSNTRV